MATHPNDFAHFVVICSSSHESGEPAVKLHDRAEASSNRRHHELHELLPEGPGPSEGADARKQSIAKHNGTLSRHNLRLLHRPSSTSRPVPIGSLPIKDGC